MSEKIISQVASRYIFFLFIDLSIKRKMHQEFKRIHSTQNDTRISLHHQNGKKNRRVEYKRIETKWKYNKPSIMPNSTVNILYFCAQRMSPVELWAQGGSGQHTGGSAATRVVRNLAKCVWVTVIYDSMWLTQGHTPAPDTHHHGHVLLSQSIFLLSLSLVIRHKAFPLPTLLVFLEWFDFLYFS